MRDRVALLRIMGHMHLRTGRGRRVTRHLAEREPAEFDIELDGGSISLRVRSSDGVLLQIMGVGVMDVPLQGVGRVETVMDLGAHVGIAAVWLARRLPGARFVCVEPAPDSFRLLEENLRRNVRDAIALNVAAVPVGGHWSLDVGFNPAMSKVVRNGEGEAVEALTVTEIMDRAGLERADLIKVDIEGGEAALFAAAADWAPRAGGILAEIHTPLEVTDAVAMLANHGFEPIALPDDPRFRSTILLRRQTT